MKLPFLFGGLVGGLAMGAMTSHAIGIVLCDGRDRVVREHKEYIGIATSNEAEYRALIKGLALAAKVTDGDVRCVSTAN